MDDSKMVAAKLDADDEVPGMFGKPYRPTLLVRCSKDKTETWLAVGRVLSTETRSWESDEAYGWTNGTPIRLRLDKDPPISNFANTSNDGQSAFLGNPTGILKKMLGHTKLLVEYTPMSSSAQTASFTIAGIGDAISDIRKACHW